MKDHDVTLRPATPEDEPFLLDLRKSTMNEHLERAGETTDELAHWARVRYRFDDAHIVCRGSEKLGLFKFFRNPAEWTIVQIQILPTHQGRGIAAKLIGDLLSQADTAQVSVTLSVLKGNKALNLYQRLGFKVVTASDTSLQMTR